MALELRELVQDWINENYPRHRVWMRHTRDNAAGSGWRLQVYGFTVADIESDHIQFYTPTNKLVHAADPRFFDIVKDMIDKLLSDDYEVIWDDERKDFRFNNPVTTFPNW